MVPAYEGKKPYIFVSYAHKDSDRVLPIIEKLYDLKYRVWYDEGISPGSEWPRNIENHLLGSKKFIAFVSEESLASINCENEVACADSNHKDMIQFRLSDESHPLMKNAAAVTDADELPGLLSKEFIGDGSGYELNISRKRFSNPWTVLLVAATVVFLALAACLFGIKNGWLDQYLPTIVEKFEELFRIENESVEPGAEIEDDAIEYALLANTQKQDWDSPVRFKDDRSRASFYSAIGKDPDTEELTYQDLTCVTDETLKFDYIADDMLRYLKYIPMLKEVGFCTGNISSFDELEDCPKLEKVYLGEDMLPADIKSPAVFSILLMQDQKISK